MAVVELRYDPKDSAWFSANATMVLKAGEPAYLSTTGQFKLGDGTTQLSALSFLPAGSGITLTTTGQSGWGFFDKFGFVEIGDNDDPFYIPMILYIY